MLDLTIILSPSREDQFKRELEDELQRQREKADKGMIFKFESQFGLL